MKKLLSLCIGMLSIGLHAADTVFVKTPQVPILIERHDNVLAYLRLDAKETKTLDTSLSPSTRTYLYHKSKLLNCIMEEQRPHKTEKKNALLL